MGRIHRLAPELADQIAAGEVVERPASVVKELVENALDAGARRVLITVDLGGKALVRVEDDGEGMDAEDARLAVERHATSKIARAQDLAAIQTLGFRGEALPSIASVSRFRLCSRARGVPAGTEVRVQGGTIVSVREVGMPEGTLVEVADLFYNVPARRKFLKSDAAEAAQISRLVTQLALAYPEVGFTLVSAGRTVLACPPAGGVADRFFQVYGERPDLVPVERAVGDVRVSGYVAALGELGPVRGPQHLFVNRRIVKDRTIAHAIADAYGSATVKERSPEVHLFLEVPPTRVDVNVHPTKAEVRFLDQSLVHEVVRRAVMDALGRGPAPALTLAPLPAGASPPLAPGLPGLAAHDEPGIQGPRDPTLSTSAPPASPDGLAAAVGGWVPLGQFRDTYIIAVDEDGIAIVDQHVAHERVLFERIMEQLTAGTPEVQPLLVPVVMSLPPSAAETLASRRPELERLGFDVEPFGVGAVRLLAAPAWLEPERAEPILRAVAEDLAVLGRAAPVEEALRRMAATMACHAAVKARDRLTRDKMIYLLDELRRTAYSTVCPHGRPVVLRLTRREIEKNFQRI